jgi:mono/diheme cytochrome c family protein
MRHVILITALLGIAYTSTAQENSDQSVTKKAAPQATAVPSGKQMYGQYCASCHGATGVGDGPVAPVLKTRPADLTTLAKRHDGVFPTQYVEDVLRFGKAPTAHGTSDMPTWGPIFQWLDGKQKSTVEQRIKNLTKYLATLQQK